MSKESSNLVTVAKQVGTKIDALEQLKSKLAVVDTPSLVSGYVMAKGFADKAKAFTEAVRSELVVKGGGGLAARFFREGESSEGIENLLTVDEKGHRYLEGANGEILKAEKRVTVSLDKAMMMAVLEEKTAELEVIAEEEGFEAEDLCEQVTVRSYHFDDDEAFSMIKRLCYRSEDEHCSSEMVWGLRRLLEMFENAMKVDLSEEKLEALVVLSKVSASDVKRAVSENVTYALKPQKKKP